MAKTVLVVEDDVGVRRVLGRLLTGCGYRVVEAGNGREAIQRLAEQTPQAIVIDLLMPIMSGAELLKALRRNPFYRSIPTVVMTGALQQNVEEVFGVPVVIKPRIELLPDILSDLLGEPTRSAVVEAREQTVTGEIST